MTKVLVPCLLRVLGSRSVDSSGPGHRFIILALSLVGFLRVHGRIEAAGERRAHGSRPILHIEGILLVVVAWVTHIWPHRHVSRPLHDITDELGVRRGELGRVVNLWQVRIRRTEA